MIFIPVKIEGKIDFDELCNRIARNKIRAPTKGNSPIEKPVISTATGLIMIQDKLHAACVRA